MVIMIGMRIKSIEALSKEKGVVGVLVSSLLIVVLKPISIITWILVLVLILVVVLVLVSICKTIPLRLEDEQSQHHSSTNSTHP